MGTASTLFLTGFYQLTQNIEWRCLRAIEHKSIRFKMALKYECNFLIRLAIKIIL